MRSKYTRGWFGESHRHYLASKGIKTNKYFNHTGRTIAGRLLSGTIAQKSAQRKARVRGAGVRAGAKFEFAQARQAASPLTETEKIKKTLLLSQLRAKTTAPAGQEFKLWDPEFSELWEDNIIERAVNFGQAEENADLDIKNFQRRIGVIEDALQGEKKGDVDLVIKRGDLEQSLRRIQVGKEDTLKKIENLNNERRLNNELRKLGGSINVDDPPDRFKKLMNKQVREFGAK